jgi:hypothetical protein
MSIRRPPPIVVRLERRHRAPWIIQLVVVLLALLVLPVLIALDLLHYLVIVPIVVNAVIG